MKGHQALDFLPNPKYSVTHITSKMPRDNGHPQPDRQRKTQWILFSENWKLQYDDEDIGIQEQWYSQGKPFEHGKDIQVPFSHETKKSGLKDTEYGLPFNLAVHAATS